MNKIKYLALLLSVLVSLNVFSQTEHIILWDVTWSMKGNANGQGDIWDETKEKIIQQIDNVNANGKSSIYILPFQNPSDNPANLDWKVISNINTIQKDELKEWVRGFDNSFKDQRSTNVCEALNMAYTKISSFASSEQIILALYTDGQQSNASKLKGCDYNNQTCMNDQVFRFCDLCDDLGRNKLYILKLTDYISNIDINCDCVEEIDMTPVTNFRTKPHKNHHYFLKENINGKHLFVFDDVFGSMPADLVVTANSSNSNTRVSSQVNINENGDFTIEFVDVTIGENQKEATEIVFNGTSKDNIEITIESLFVEIENVKKSKVVIKEIKIK